MKINRRPLALILTTDRTLKSSQAGTTHGPVVVIRPGYEADHGLLAHELAHVRQFWRYGLAALLVIAGTGLLGAVVMIAGIEIPLHAFALLGLLLNPALYALWPEWRFVDEVAAYRAQANFYPDDRRRLFAHFIATRYDLDISEDEAFAELQK